jgi:hypothetical protein
MSDIGDIDTLLGEYAEAEHIAAKSGLLTDYDRANAIRAKIDAAVALLRELRSDAERFRWLSAGNEAHSLPSGRYTVWSGELNANFDGDSLGEAIDAAWLVVERMSARGFHAVVKSPFVPGELYHAGFTPHGTTGWNGRPDFRGSAATAAEAICRAALEAR